MEDENIVNNIKFLLHSCMMTQKDLAERLNIEPHTVNQWLNKRVVPADRIPEIANIFEISIAWLRSDNKDFQTHFNEKKVLSNKELVSKIHKDTLSIFFPYIKDEKLIINRSFKDSVEIDNKISGGKFEKQLRKLETEKELNDMADSLYQEEYKEGIDCFKKAVEIHNKISEYKLEAKKELVDKCCNLYHKAFKKGVREALINMISINAINSYINRKTEENANDFLIYDVFELIKLINYSLDDKELVDYNIAILFKFNLIDISYQKSENSLFGDMYLTVLATLGNKYALSYIDYAKKWLPIFQEEE